MNWITDIFTSGGFGAVIGTFGSWLAKREERKNLQLQYAHTEKMAEFNAKHELDIADSDRQTEQVKGQIQKEVIQEQAFKESIKTQAINTGVKLVDAIRGVMRPGITVYLLVASTLVATKIWVLVGGLESLTDKEVFDLFRLVVMELIFLTSTAVSWWFGSRPGRGIQNR